MKQVSLLNQIDFIEYGFYDAQDSQLSQNPILMNQVHSADALFIDKQLQSSPQVDALITNVSGLNLTVKTADCAPILVVDTKAKLIAAIHAGWKGAFQGVIENTILQMCQLGGDVLHMVAAVGPHLQKESFEADTQMYSLFPITEHHFFTEQTNGKFLFDFHQYVLHRLKRTGITQIDSVLIDTFTNNKYNSYRRDPKNPARQYSSICLKD